MTPDEVEPGLNALAHTLAIKAEAADFFLRPPTLIASTLKPFNLQITPVMILFSGHVSDRRLVTHVPHGRGGRILGVASVDEQLKIRHARFFHSWFPEINEISSTS